MDFPVFFGKLCSQNAVCLHLLNKTKKTSRFQSITQISHDMTPVAFYGHGHKHKQRAPCTWEWIPPAFFFSLEGHEALAYVQNKNEPLKC